MPDGPCGPHCGTSKDGKYMIHCTCSSCHPVTPADPRPKPPKDSR